MSNYKLIKLNPFGVSIDTNPHDVDDGMWTNALNMRFNNKASEKFGGESEVFTTTAQGTHLLFNGSHTEPYWLYFGDGIARVTDLTTDKDIEGAALTTSVNWDTSLFNLFPICNNTVDTPRYWAGDFTAPDTLADLPAFEANTLCEAIRPFRGFLVALNTTTSGTQAPNRVLWSDLSDSGALPASWDITDPSTLAGDTYLTDDKGEIIDGHQLRDLFVIFKTHSTYLMRLIGGQSVMRIDKVQVNSGLLAKNCIAEFKGRLFVVSDGDIVLFDGQNVESIADKRVRDSIFNNIDGTFYINSYVVRYDIRDEMWFCYPSTGQEYPDIAAVWNWKDNTWAFRSLIDTKYITTSLNEFGDSPTWDSLTTTTWDSYNTTWKAFGSNPAVDALCSITTLGLNALDITYDTEGAAFPSNLEKVTMDFDNPDMIKIVKSVTPRITADAGTKVYIRIGTQMNPDDNITWGTEHLYTVGTDREAFFTQKGRFISIRMRTQDIGANWACHGFNMKVAESGKH